MNRKAIVNGKFYAEFPDNLKSQINECYIHPQGPGIKPDPVVDFSTFSQGLIVPHAGYMYSGPIAAWGYKKLSDNGRTKNVIVVCPNHTGYGRPLSVLPDGYWETPFGKVKVNEELSSKIVSLSHGSIESDTGAHTFEHAIEVQLPFLQESWGEEFSIVPISMGDQSPEAVKILSNSIIEATKEMEPVTIIASSDLNHYASHNTTMEKDNLLIDAITRRELDGIFEIARKNKISACGIGPICTVLSIFKDFELLKHASSGDISGDLIHTVGYMSAYLK